MDKEYFKQESGITGLETAIILISFVVVAAVFAYTVISAGIFSTQKSKEAVHSGLQRVQSTLELKSSVIAVAANSGAQGYLSQIKFDLANSLGGNPVDFTPPLTSGTNGRAPANSPNKIVISYKDSIQKVDDLFWTFTQLGSNNGDTQLDAGEQFEVTIGNVAAAQNGGNLVDALSTRHLKADTAFSIEIKTGAGATLTFERITPSWIDPVMDLNTSNGVNLVGSQTASGVIFTATVTPISPGTGIPTGTIQFNIDGAPYGTPVALAGGSAASLPNNSLTVGDHNVTADYSGDTDFTASSSGILIQHVN
jgi:archaeal flagellin FlaB